MTALTDRAIKSTYTDLLQVSNSGNGVDASLRNVSDGEGTASALELSTTSAKIQGDLVITGDLSANTVSGSALGNIVTAATTAQVAASSSATAAATSATNASNSATAAATSQTDASNSATSSATSAAASATSAAASAASAASAAADLAEFQGQYHGAASSAPTTGLDVGDLWFDSVATAMKVYDGAAWVAAYISEAGTLTAANNLSDVSSASASRANLGLDTMATQASTAVDIDGGSIDGTVIGGSSAAAGTFTTAVVSGTSSSDLVRITQTGAGNALVVEDSTNPDSTPFVVDASGNTGIGTSAPAEKLSIETGASEYALQWSGPGDDWVLASSANRAYIKDKTSAVEAISILNAGNVGIGEVSPGYKLDVAGDAGFDNNISIENTSGFASIEMGGASGAYIDLKNPFSDDYDARIFSDGTNMHIVHKSAGPLVFNTGVSEIERMRIDSSGRVGIGRTPTTNLLEVAGTIESTTGGFKFPDGSTQTKSAGHGLSAMIALGMA